MKIAWIVAVFCLASAAASVVPVKGERKLADAEFLKKQKQVLDLFTGLGHTDFIKNEGAEYNFHANSEHFTDPTVVTKFKEMYERGMLPKNLIFTMSCPHVRHQYKLLFDVFFFAKDFDTFYEVAKWAKHHIHPVMFAWAAGTALHFREDTHNFVLPPFYEVFPNYFVPQDIMHEVYDHKMAGVKKGKFEFNNTGYEYNYHDNMFGGQLNAYKPHNEYVVSYFREDVGLATAYIRTLLFAPFMEDPKYNLKFYNRGEMFYYIHQQILARYTMERLAHGLPYVAPFSFSSKIPVGYAPKITHVNGLSFLARQDEFDVQHGFGYWFKKAQRMEERLMDTLYNGGFWNHTSHSFVDLFNRDGFEAFGRMVSGFSHESNQKFHGSYFNTLLEALGYTAWTNDNYNYNGGVTSFKVTALKDPAFYSVLARVVYLFQKLKSKFHPYMEKDLKFPGVSVSNFEVDKLMTYFDMFDFEVTNGVGVSDGKEYIDTKYEVSQYRLNHKPFNYHFTVKSDAAYEGMVRIFIGPKFDSEGHLLSLEQKRMTMYELDRFPVKLNTGENIIERSSKESLIFSSDKEGFRNMYKSVNHAINTNEPYYFSEKMGCGVPERLQLPMGWKGGLPYTFAVVVTPYNHPAAKQDEGAFCGSTKLYDGLPYGFPFDRPVWNSEWNVPNIFFKDEFIYHKEDHMDINRI